MHQEQVPIPGARDVMATLDEPDDGADAVVVACPPHPQLGGHRGDRRLTAVSEALVDAGVACLRFDYGEWDEGYGEREDARNALRWAADRYDRVGLFGFSFGGGVAALAAATTEVSLHAVALLAPASRLTADLDAVAAFDSISAPVQVVYGTRDETADWAPLVERARECEQAVVEMSADHHFIGQEEKVGTTVATFLARNLR